MTQFAFFFVVYIAIIPKGGQSAGQFFSFGPNIAQAKASANRILAARQPTHSFSMFRRDHCLLHPSLS
ncbi:hypothetical protein ACN38_g6715 [Penicillium nordicum]|uniref:Secreted protein n=1 Tax=Penicillium nordicum TaxID=229535 RepID=A0A0M9WF20_9EURO|nr:hypothetical protein ACN38_g6715 [Penicillium nordicum]